MASSLNWQAAKSPLGACLVIAWLLLAGCTVVPNEELPEGVTDSRADLVSHIRDNPNDLQAHADLLRLQIRSGDEVGAEATIAHAVRHNAEDYRTWLLAAQGARWQLDLINTEKHLLRARDLAPDRLEPRIALAGLYNQAYLEKEELEQRTLVLELAPLELRPEFTLDLAYAQAALGGDARALELAQALLADASAMPGLRARAQLLCAELGLRTGSEASLSFLQAACASSPSDRGILQFAARATTMPGAAALGAVFDKTLDGQDRTELRWTALFGKWMLAVHAAIAAGTDPLAEDCEVWRQRLDAMEPGHPDVTGRYFQLLKLNPARSAEADTVGAQLDELGVGLPPVPQSHELLLSMWRAEDSLRLGAPGVTLAQTTRLLEQAPDLEGVRMLFVMALFKLRDDAACLKAVDGWLAENEKPDDLLLSIRWWLMLRDSKGPEVLREVQELGVQNNSRQWIEAVAKLHTFRG